MIAGEAGVVGGTKAAGQTAHGIPLSASFRKSAFEDFARAAGPVNLMKTLPSSLSTMAPRSIEPGIGVLAPPGMPLR